MKVLEPNHAAASYRETVRQEISEDGLRIRLRGILANDAQASAVYADYVRSGCAAVGIEFELIRCAPEDAMSRMQELNRDPDVHGIFVYYPIWHDERDAELRDAILPSKDVEGLSTYWVRKLYRNERFDDAARIRKSILPCTPLAIIKLLETTDAYSQGGLPFQGLNIAVFNRSEVVGRPLAFMLGNDGARVFSFDIDGGVIVEPGSSGRESGAIDRAQALREADVVITGVPSRNFEMIRAEEIRPGAICMNFSSVPNFEQAAKEAAGLYIPRVGTMTVAMCMRNALRLYRNYHQGA